MRSASHISVLRHIVHITDRKRDLLQLAEQETELDDEMRSYFVDHIENSLQKPSTRAATFCNPDNPETGGLCRGLIAGEVDFIDGSHQLARRLFDNMDRRITSGGFAVILFEATINRARHDGEERRTLLALLKMDVGSRYVTQFDEANNRTQLRKQENTLPSKSDGLHKCAFIWREDRDPEDTQHYDLMLLDDQKSGDQDVARFFQQDFLDAEFAFNSRRQGQKFINVALDAIDQAAKEEGWDEDQKMELRDAAYDALERPLLDVPVWAQELPAEEKPRQLIETILRNSLEDLSFEPEKISKPRRVVFRGDDGLEVKIARDSVNRILRSEDAKVDADGSIYHEIVLRTNEWGTKK